MSVKTSRSGMDTKTSHRIHKFSHIVIATFKKILCSKLTILLLSAKHKQNNTAKHNATQNNASALKSYKCFQIHLLCKTPHNYISMKKQCNTTNKISALSLYSSISNGNKDLIICNHIHVFLNGMGNPEYLVLINKALLCI